LTSKPILDKLLILPRQITLSPAQQREPVSASKWTADTALHMKPNGSAKTVWLFVFPTKEKILCQKSPDCYPPVQFPLFCLGFNAFDTTN